MIKLQIFCLMVFLLGCSTHPKPTWSKHHIYSKDFDLFTLKPLNVLTGDEIKYPFISFFENDTIKVVGVHIDENSSENLYFKKKDNLWTSLDSVQEDHLVYIKNVIYNDTIYVIDYYEDNGLKYIIALRILMYGIAKNYTIQNDYVFKDETIYNDILPWHIDITNCIRSSMYIQDFRNQKLSMKSLNFSWNGDERLQEVCFYLGNYPNIFFQTFSWKFNKVKCP